MIYLVFIAFSVLRGLNAVAVKMAQKDHLKNLHDSIYFTVLFSFFQSVFLFMIPPWTKYTFKADMFIYPACFAVFYSTSYVLLVSSLREGPTSLTNIVYSFQSIVPVIAGLILWKESMGIYQVFGLILFCLVLILFNKSSYSEAGIEQKKISIKWAFLSGLSALSVGIAVLFTKQYMLKYDGFIKEYLIAFNFVIIMLGLPYLTILRFAKKQRFPFNRRFLFFTASPALITNLTNTIFMTYITRFQSVFFFPLMSILNIISIVVSSRVILKEKVSKIACAGIALSFAAIYLLGLN